MALNATVFKAELQISDMDRQYYQHHRLTLARHPSETDERMMVRLLAFALHADEQLSFTRGLCVDDEPALWRKDLTGLITQWIDVGLPHIKHLRKASHRSEQVIVYGYGGHACELWWAKQGNALRTLNNVAAFNLAQRDTQALSGLAHRTMRLQCTIEDGHVWFSDDQTTVEIVPQQWR